MIFFKRNDPYSDKMCHICAMLIIMRINTITYTPTSNANSRSDNKLHQYRIIQHKLNKHITIVFMIVNCYKFVTNIYIMDQFHHIVNIIHNFDILITTVHQFEILIAICVIAGSTSFIMTHG